MQRQKPIAIAGEMCRYFHKDVSKVCHKCHHYVKLQGQNANTGEDVDEWMCADVASVILQAENSQQTRQAGASIDILRHHVAEGNKVMAIGVQSRLMELKQNG